MIDAALIEPRSALHHRMAIGTPGSVRMAEIRLATLSILRGQGDALAGPIGDALGLDLPRKACTATSGDAHAALWLGPDEWMLVSPHGEEAAHAALDDALAGTHHQRVTVSDHYTLVALEGPCARDLLAKLVPIDTHRRALAPGQVLGTVLGAANTHVWCVGDDRFRLLLRRSYADYAWCLMARAGREWSLPAQVPFAGERLTV